MTTPTSLTAEPSLIDTTSTPTNSITATSTPATRSTETDLAAEVRGSMVLRLLTFSQERALGRSVALITVAMSEAFPPAGGRALEVVSMAAVGDIGDRMYQQ